MQQPQTLSSDTVAAVRTLAGLAMALGVTTLCGWIWGMDTLKTILPGLPSMKANTALGMTLGGLVLCLQTFPGITGLIPGLRRLGGGLLLLLGMVTLAEYAFAWDPGIDQLVQRVATGDTTNPIPDPPFSKRMSLLSAGCYVLLGGAFLLTEWGRHWSSVQGLAILVVLIALLPLGGYLHGNVAFPHLGQYPQMAAHAALGFLLLGLGVLTLTSEVGILVRIGSRLPILGMGAVVALLLVAGNAALYGMTQSQVATAWVDHTYEVRLHLQALQAAIARLNEYQEGLRAHRLGEKTAPPATQGPRAHLLSEIDTVQRLTADNLAQQQRLAALRPLLHQLLTTTDPAPQRQPAPRPGATIGASAAPGSDPLSTEVIRRLAEIEAEEVTLQEQRQRAAEIRHATSTLAVRFTLLLSLVLLIWIGMAWRRAIGQQRQGERALIAAKLAAEAANRSKGDFLSNMSHEIRTPMNAILGMTRLALETPLTPKQQDYLHKVHTSAQALLTLLNDILDLSKIESGHLEIERIEFDPSQLLGGVADLFLAKVEEKGLEMVLDCDPGLPSTVWGDPLRIRQILINLVGNALKFTARGEVHLRLAPGEPQGDNTLPLHFSVRDTGIGIEEEVLPHLFQPFHQGDASITRRFGGTGLGLAISKQLVDLLGGEIAVASERGQGATFSFTVRCGIGEGGVLHRESHPLRGIRVLVVDDLESSREMLRRILDSWHLEVETARSGKEGLQRLAWAEHAGTPIDLVLLDWRMEGMSGLDVAREFHRQEAQGLRQHHPAVIMVTAYNKDRLLQEASTLAVDLDAILTKPIVPSHLLDTLLTVYKRPGRGQGLEPQAEARPAPREASHPLRDARILLVEDNEINQQLACELLEKAGMRVAIAQHGGEAIQFVQRIAFDAVLMDVQMPEMDGYEATRRIRALPAGRDLPIIAMTAAAMRQDQESCLAAGMNDHITKPIDPERLLDCLRRWVKPKAAPQAPVPAPTSPPPVSPERDEGLPGLEFRGNSGDTLPLSDGPPKPGQG